MITVSGMVDRYGKSRKTILAAISRLKIGKDGRDYLLTQEQEDAVIAEMHGSAGHPSVYTQASRRLKKLNGFDRKALEFCLEKCEASKKEARWFLNAEKEKIDEILKQQFGELF